MTDRQRIVWLAAITTLFLSIIGYSMLVNYVNDRNIENSKICFGTITDFNSDNSSRFISLLLSKYHPVKWSGSVVLLGKSGATMRHDISEDGELCHLLFIRKDVLGNPAQIVSPEDVSDYALYVIPDKRGIKKPGDRTEMEKFFYAMRGGPDDWVVQKQNISADDTSKIIERMFTPR